MTNAALVNICGFLVVRRPSFAFTKLVRPKLTVGDKTYFGMDRFPWEDLDEAYYGKRLPSELLAIWKKLDRDSGFLGIKLLRSYEEALEVLRFSGEKAEIIAVWSFELEKIKGATQCSAVLELRGIDCLCLGEWSILLSGAYLHPDKFPATVQKLNYWGLLSSDEDCDELILRYQALAADEVVEPLMTNPKFTNVRIFGVPTD
jgi:hypothetical protein